MADIPDISVVICTRNRAQSLRQTLGCLAEADRNGLDVEIVVVCNACDDDSKDIPGSFRGVFPTRIVIETRPGKSYATNTALKAGGFGEIIAFLDDDMSPNHDWFQQIKAGCAKWRDCDFFTGNSYVIWPCSEVPGWALGGRLNSWAFSVSDWGDTDCPLGPKLWPGGGHFWVRRRVLESGIQFDQPIRSEFAVTGYVTDPDFILQMMACGLRGVAIPSAVTGHRVQEHLLNRATIRRRAITMGKSLPYVRCAYPQVCWQARLLQKHRFIAVNCCALNAIRHYFTYLRAGLVSNVDRRFATQMALLVALHNNLEVVRHGHWIRCKMEANCQKVQQLRPRLAQTRRSAQASVVWPIGSVTDCGRGSNLW